MKRSFASVEVFYSFAEADVPLLEQLERHLSLLRHEGYLSTWHKRQIVAGSDWRGEVDRHLTTASLILLLISSDFLASDYCYGTEMRRALQRHEANEAMVIPILLRPCDWQSAPFATLRALPTGNRPITTWHDRDEAWTDVVIGMRQLLAETFVVEGSATQKTHQRGREATQTVNALFLADNPRASDSRHTFQRLRGTVTQRGFILLMVFCLLVGSVGMMLFLTRPPTSSPKNSMATLPQITKSNIPATAQGSTAQAKGTTSAGVQQPGITATVQRVASDPYPPSTGTLVLNDPLRDNTRGYGWEEGMRDQGTCTFVGGTYQSTISLARYFHSCLALSTNYRNFAYEVQMTLVSASEGGIVFRADRTTTHFYYFTVDRQGGYLLKAYYDKVGGATVVAKGSGIAFSNTEIIGVVAQGNTLSLYINHQLIRQLQDTTLTQGQIGVVVYEGSGMFSNAKLWTL